MVFNKAQNKIEVLEGVVNKIHLIIIVTRHTQDWWWWQTQDGNHEGLRMWYSKSVH